MTSITDPNMSDRFTSNLEEIHNKQLKTYGEIIDTTTELCQAHKQFMKSALGKPEFLLLLDWNNDCVFSINLLWYRYLFKEI